MFGSREQEERAPLRHRMPAMLLDHSRKAGRWQCSVSVRRCLLCNNVLHIRCWFVMLCHSTERKPCNSCCAHGPPSAPPPPPPPPPLPLCPLPDVTVQADAACLPASVNTWAGWKGRQFRVHKITGVEQRAKER